MEYGGMVENATSQNYIDFIRSNDVDVACLQETSTMVNDTDCEVIVNKAIEIAKALGWNYFL